MQTKLFSLVVFSIVFLIVGFLYWIKPNAVSDNNETLMVSNTLSETVKSIKNESNEREVSQPLLENTLSEQLEINEVNSNKNLEKTDTQKILPDSIAAARAKLKKNKGKIQKENEQRLELEAKQLLELELNDYPYYLLGYEIGQELTRDDLISIVKKFNFQESFASKLPMYQDDVKYEYKWENDHLIVTYYLVDEGETIHIPLNQEDFQEEIDKNYYGLNTVSLNDFESGHVFTKQELIDLLLNWYEVPSYIENENTIINYSWEGELLHIDAYFENEYYNVTLDKKWFVDEQSDDFDFFMQDGVDYNLSENPDKQYYDVMIEYSFQDGWFVLRDQEKLDTYRSTVIPEFNIKDSVLKQCILNALNLKSSDIPNTYQMLSLLVIECDGVKSLSGLESWKHLKGIQLGVESNIDFSVLTAMPGLQFLKLTGSGMTLDINKLNNIKSLNTLVLNDLKILNRNQFSKFSNLNRLFLDNNNIDDLSFLKSMTSLTVLDVRHNLLKENGRNFDLPNGIFELTLRDIGLENLDFINTMDYLINVDFSNNDITYIPEKLLDFDLYMINFSNNNISDVSLFANINNLYQLDISNNKITDISFLSRMGQLSIVDASDNYIEYLPDFSTLYYLEEIDLRNNDSVDCIRIRNSKTSKLLLKCE